MSSQPLRLRLYEISYLHSGRTRKALVQGFDGEDAYNRHVRRLAGAGHDIGDLQFLGARRVDLSPDDEDARPPDSDPAEI